MISTAESPLKSTKEVLRERHSKVENPLGTSCEFSNENLRRLSIYTQQILEPGQEFEQVFLQTGDAWPTEEDGKLREPIIAALTEHGIPPDEINTTINFSFQGISEIERNVRQQMRNAQIEVPQETDTITVKLSKNKVETA
jgi:hypothetical protein